MGNFIVGEEDDFTDRVRKIELYTTIKLGEISNLERELDVIQRNLERKKFELDLLKEERRAIEKIEKRKEINVR